MTRHTSLCLIVPLVCSFASPAVASPLRLAAGGKTNYSIVVDPEAIAAERHAAEELASFLQQITGAQFPIQATAQTPAGPLLLVGPGRVTSQVAPHVNLDGLKPDRIV
nr:hypothetical protein [Pirellulaceae bacterium]